MNQIDIYTKPSCPYCDFAKALLDQKGLTYNEIDISEDEALREQMIERASGKRTVPQIFMNGIHIGGFTDLQECQQSGRLDEILKA